VFLDHLDKLCANDSRRLSADSFSRSARLHDGVSAPVYHLPSSPPRYLALPGPDIRYLISNIIYRRVRAKPARGRNLRKFNPASLFADPRAARNGAGYKLDELRRAARLTPPFPHPSAKLVEFSAILPAGSSRLLPRRYLPSASRFTVGRIKPLRRNLERCARGNRKADSNRSARSRLIARSLRRKGPS